MNLTFENLTPEQLSSMIGETITSDMNLEAVAEAIESDDRHSIFYISYSLQDVLEAIFDEWDMAVTLNPTLIELQPQGICIALNL